MGVSDAQEIVLIVLTIVSSLISVTGSSLVLHVIRKDLQKSSPYHRLIAGMSCVDLIFSTSCILQMFLRPKFLGIPGAIGNFATCSFVGFFFVSGSMAVAIYSVLISGNAYLLVCRRWSEKAIATSWERKGHVASGILPLTLMIPAAFTKTINVPHLSSICVLFVYPQECFQNEDEVECTRGGGLYFPMAVTFTVAVLLCSITSCVLTIKVYRSVKCTIRRSSQYNFQEQVQNSDEQPNLPSSSTASSRKENKDNISKSGQTQLDLVRSQTIRFFFAYLNSIIWPLLMIVVGNVAEDVDKAYPIRLVSAMFYPLQGGFNMIIFCKPSINAWKRSQPELSLKEIMHAIVVERELHPPRRRLKSSSQSKSSKPSLEEIQNQSGYF